MNIEIPPPFKFYKPTFGITVKKPVKKIYAPNCWNEVSEGQFKNCSFFIYNNFLNGRKGSTLISYHKYGIWVKSKLKYIENGIRKTLWSYAKDD